MKSDTPPIPKDGNYAVLITSDNCIWCVRMYPLINDLRDQGYKIYVINLSEYPSIKKDLNAMDPDARRIGNGAPWFIIRSGGKTTKVFRGFQEAETIMPHVKKPKPKPEEDPKPVVPDYNLR